MKFMILTDDFNYLIVKKRIVKFKRDRDSTDDQVVQKSKRQMSK